MSPTQAQAFQVPRHRRPAKDNWYVDPIYTAATIRLKKLRAWKAAKSEWWTKVMNILLATQSKDWCGFEASSPDAWQETYDMSKEQIDELARQHAYKLHGGEYKTNPVLKFIGTKADKNGFRMVAALFLVKKSVNRESGKVLARVVYSSKKSNKQFKRPPGFKLPSLARIFKCMAAFKDPHFVTLDFRHFFYQIPLPNCVRPLFSVRRDGQTWEHVVFPMGFTWSPFVGQSITMATLLEARSRWAMKNNWSQHQPQVPQESIPEVIEFYDDEGIAAFAMGWYDNVIIIAKDEKTRQEVAVELEAVLMQANIIVKGSDEEATLASAQALPRWSGWSFTKNEVEYIGIQFKSSDHKVSWRHIQSNREDWEEQINEWSEDSARNVASAVGILLWDLRVKNIPLSALVEELGIMSAVGSAMKGWKSWDSLVALDPAKRDALKEKVRAVAQDASFKVYTLPVKHETTRIICVAADASDIRGAYVILEGRDSYEHSQVHWLSPWTASEKARSINCRETKTAIEALKFIDAQFTDKRGLEVRFAEDNMTAVAALNAWFYPRDADLCAEFLLLYSAFQEATITPTYFPTETMPADEPSRNKVFREDKAKTCWEFLIHGAASAGLKRPRD